MFASKKRDLFSFFLLPFVFYRVRSFTIISTTTTKAPNNSRNIDINELPPKHHAKTCRNDRNNHILTSSVSAYLDYRDFQDNHDDSVASVMKPTIRKSNIDNSRKTIKNIENGDDFKTFLDKYQNQIVAVKFYASWCKSCQKLKAHYHRLGSKSSGSEVYFAEMRLSKDTDALIKESLQIRAFPTIHLYHGYHKVWEISGKTNTREMEKELQQLRSLEPADLTLLSEHRDDGVLRNYLFEMNDGFDEEEELDYEEFF